MARFLKLTGIDRSTLVFALGMVVGVTPPTITADPNSGDATALAEVQIAGSGLTWSVIESPSQIVAAIRAIEADAIVDADINAPTPTAVAPVTSNQVGLGVPAAKAAAPSVAAAEAATTS